MSGIQLTQNQRQTQILSHQMIQSVEILQMNGQELTDYIIEYTDNSEVVTAQRNDPSTNVLTGIPFTAGTDDEKAESARKYLRLFASQKYLNSFRIFFAQI